MDEYADLVRVVVITIAVTGVPAVVYLGVRAGLAVIRRMEREGSPAVDQGMAAEVAHLRAGLSEMQERMDFAERLLPRHEPPAFPNQREIS